MFYEKEFWKERQGRKGKEKTFTEVKTQVRVRERRRIGRAGAVARQLLLFVRSPPAAGQHSPLVICEKPSACTKPDLSF